MALFVVVNYFGVQWFAKTNNVVTAFKIIVPTLTVVLLVASGFGHHRGAGGTGNFSSQGFAPMGWSAALSAIATAGMIFAYTGFRNIIELSGEASNPKRDIPRALVGTIGIAFVLYMLLQVAFLMAVPSGMLAKAGWTGIDFDSPFAQLAKLLGFMWLYWLLIADSMVSPSGSGIVYTASNARNAYGLAKSRLLPRMFTDVNERSGVPAKALLFNLAVGVLFIVLLPSWQSLVEMMSVLAVFTFSIGAVSLHVFRNNGVGDDSTRLRGMGLIAPAAFVVSTLVILWEPWDILRKTIPVIVATLLYYVFVHVRHRFSPRRAERRHLAGRLPGGRLRRLVRRQLRRPRLAPRVRGTRWWSERSRWRCTCGASGPGRRTSAPTRTSSTTSSTPTTPGRRSLPAREGGRRRTARGLRPPASRDREAGRALVAGAVEAGRRHDARLPVLGKDESGCTTGSRRRTPRRSNATGRRRR